MKHATRELEVPFDANGLDGKLTADAAHDGELDRVRVWVRLADAQWVEVPRKGDLPQWMDDLLTDAELESR